MVKPKPPRGQSETRLGDPSTMESSDPLHKVTETLAAHSLQIDKVCTSHATLEGWSDSGGCGGVMGEGTLRILLDNAHRLRYVHKTL
ncbi:hypothetical protein NDU88_002341 [Pleurodeles waltl]|uniref:Uncharacterized protein n=1 Tax=Pleurodeles waltl TaxID=8319 RepID=A0AAV7UAX6_PLEWA|nr:hypothetical protein NDU88_002341 [Pleurodeles waltl]